MANAIASQVQALYVGYLGRAADQAGLDFWTNAITAGTSTIESVALGFTLSQEYTSKYEGLSNEELAAAIYENVLGRAADADGLAFWVGELEKGVQTPETLLAAMINSLGAVDQKVIDNKVLVANAFTTAAGENYDAAAGAKVLVGVDGTEASVEAALATIPGATFTLTASATTVNEDGSITYTVTASEAVTAATDVVFTLVPGSTTAADQGTATANLNDFGQGAFNPVTVPIPVGGTTATFTVTPPNDDMTELAESFSVQAVVAGQTLTKSATLLDGSAGAGQTFTLTTSVDNVVGTNGNDTINAVLNGANSTLTALDVIDGGAGTDTLNIDEVVAAALPGGLTIKNVENAVVRSAGDATVDSTTWAGLTSLKATQATTVDLTAATTTAVEVSGATGATVAVNGGSTVAVTTSTADQAVTIGEDAVSAGAVSVTHTKQGTADIQVDGGTNVTVVASGVSSGDILIGQTIGGATVAADQPSGDISVTSTGAAYTAAYVSAALGPITIDGGKTVSVTQSATSDSSAVATDTSAGTVTQSAVTVNGGASTTSVTIKQDAAVTADNAVAAVAGAQEVQTVTFGAMTATQTLIINGLTFTASKALTAAEVAAAFAGLTNGTTQGSAPAGNGVYSGTFSTISGSTGAVTTTATASTVTFTSTAKVDVAALTIAGTAAGTSVTATTNGSAETTAVTGVMGVVGGAVVIEGNITGTDVLATVSLNGYGASSAIDSDALTSLTLANSKADLDVDNLAATTLALSLNKIGTGSSLDIGSTYTTLNVTATGADSDVTLVAGGVQTLTVAGDKSVDLSGATLSALKTVTVSGSAGLTIDASGATVTAVNTAATTGTVTATVDASKATYTGGAGVDNVTVTAATLAKAILLGAGDDKLVVGGATLTGTWSANGGDGTDTLAMASAQAAAASLTATFETKIDSFERLALGATSTVGGDTVDLANLDDISYVITAGGTTALNLDNMAANGTLVFNDAASVLVDVDLADATGTADVLNVVTKLSTAGINFGDVNAAGVETINLTVSDTSTTAGIQTATLDLSDAALKTVVVTGNSNLILTTDSVVLTMIDGSAMTGTLTAGTNGTVAQTIKGGSGADSLTANGNGDTLIGGAGSDTLIATGNLNTLTGGAGADTFDISDATTNVNSFATITDLAAGDKIKFSVDAADFMASKVVLADTAVFQDYANAAIALSGDGDVSWFQFNGNTYIVENVATLAEAGADNGVTFANGEDIIVKITGTVDLSTASFSSSADTLLIV